MEDFFGVTNVADIPVVEKCSEDEPIVQVPTYCLVPQNPTTLIFPMVKLLSGATEHIYFVILLYFDSVCSIC